MPSMAAEPDPAVPDPIRDGVRLFNEEHFFEAHEILEEVWHRERGEPRRFLQGLIQLCAAYHHVQNGNLVGATELLQRGAEKMRPYPARYLGFDAAELIRRAEADREHLLAERLGAGAADPIKFPKITLEAG